MILPADIIRYICLNLSPKDVLSLCLSNKYYQNVVWDSSYFWRSKIMIDYPNQLKYIPDDYKSLTNKELYILFSEKSKIIVLNISDYPDLKGVDDSVDERVEIVDRAIKKKKPGNMKRGDVIRFGWFGDYRNANKYMWNGEKVISLSYYLDGYGSVSKEFKFSEFRPDYFVDSIYHNTIINLNDEKIEEIRKNYDPYTQTSYVTDRYNTYKVKTYNDRTYNDRTYNDKPIKVDIWCELDQNGNIIATYIC